MSEEQVSRETVRGSADEIATEAAAVSSARSFTKQGPPNVELDIELLEGVRRALAGMGFSDPDQDTIEMISRAAHLTPDDAKPAISTTRLFAAAVALGEASSNPYPSALTTVIQADRGLSESYRNITGLFKTEPAQAALERLRPRWFSDNVEKILQTARSEDTSASSSDAIIRALVRCRSGLVRKRIDLDRVAAAIETQLQLSRKDAPQSVMDEINALLEGLKIPVTDAVRRRLLWAANQRGTVDLDRHHLLTRFLTIEPGNQGLPTDPTSMAIELLRSLGTDPNTLPEPPLDMPTSPSNPLRFSKELESLLQRGLSVQQRIFLNPALGTKGLVAAWLTTLDEEHDIDRDRKAATVERFQEIVRQRLPPDEARRWNRALERETRNFPKLNTDQPGIGPPRDRLGITMDALAIANVAAGKNTSLPLAFGIFGDWGAGKTFFMRLIQEQIAGFVKSGTKDDGFEHAIVQIQFNAWHYAETNLWASLVGHIFEELDRWMTRNQDGESTETADKILKRLSTSRQLTLEAATELVQRRKEHAKAGAKLTEAQTTLTNAEKEAAKAPATAWGAVVNTMRMEIAKDDEVRQQLTGIESALSMPALLEHKASLTAAFEQLDRSASAGRAALGALRSTVGSGRTVALAIFTLVGVPLLLFGLHRVADETVGLPAWAEIGRGIEALAGLLAALSVLVGSFARRAKSLADKFVQLKANVDAEIANATRNERLAAEEAAAKVAKSATAVEQAKTLVHATGEQVAAALKDYAEETGSHRISRFVRARAGADGYGRHLGLVSTIRKDFDQLESLMLNRNQEPPKHLEDARKQHEARVKALIDEAGAALEPDEVERIEETTFSMRDLKLPEAMEFRRIVLYIDDLDRCEPAKVVEVLQAVNMLLTFQLFVVMVAVDARWLSRSLETRYPEFFGVVATGDGANGRDQDEAKVGSGNGKNGVQRATTADYLEKIFQIPYWVPGMTAATSKALVADLIAADRASDGAGGGTDHTVNPTPPPRPDPQPPAPAVAEDDQPRTMEPPPESLRLTNDEINALTVLSPYLGGSPRRARRFVNVYRVAKASLLPGDVKILEAGEYKALATQLAIATGAPNAFAAWVDICATADDSSVGQRLSTIGASEEERLNIDRALEAFRLLSPDAGERMKLLAGQSGRAGRFSFAVPHKAEPPLPLPVGTPNVRTATPGS